MYRIKSIQLVAALILTASISMAAVVQTTVEAITESPNLYQNELVKISGLVTTYIPGDANTTAYYLIKGDFGDVIRINTSVGAPETNRKYCVSGIVYVQKVSKNRFTAFISEQTRYDGVCNEIPSIGVSHQNLNFGKLKLNDSQEEVLGITNTGTANLELRGISISNEDVFKLIMPTKNVLAPGESTELLILYTPHKLGNYSGIVTITSNASNQLDQIVIEGSTAVPTSWFIALGAAFVLLVLLIVLLVIRKRASSSSSYIEDKKIAVDNMPMSNLTQNVTQPILNSNEYNTIAIPRSAPKTVKLFPGEFEVTTGSDAGKKFKMPGFTKDNSLVISVGREKPSSDMAQYHIQLKENTVSRKQAEFIFKDGNVFLRNIGTTNYSVVDGNEVLPNDVVQLKSGSINQFGDVSIKYIY